MLRFVFAIVVSLFAQVSFAQERETTGPVIEPEAAVTYLNQDFVVAPSFWQDSPIDRLAKIARANGGNIEKTVEEYLANPSPQDMEEEFWAELRKKETREEVCALLPTVMIYSNLQFEFLLSKLGLSGAELDAIWYQAVDASTSEYLALISRETLKGFRTFQIAQTLEEHCDANGKVLSLVPASYLGAFELEILQFWIARDPSIGGNLFELNDNQLFTGDDRREVLVSLDLNNSYLQSAEFFLDGEVAENRSEEEVLHLFCGQYATCIDQDGEISDKADPVIHDIIANPRRLALVTSIRPWQNDSVDGGPKPSSETAGYEHYGHFNYEQLAILLDRFFPEIEELRIVGGRVSLDWKSLPNNVHTIKIYRSPSVTINLPNWRGRHIRINWSIIEEINLNRASLEQGFNTSRSYVETGQNRWHSDWDAWAGFVDYQYSFSEKPRLLDFRSIQAGYLDFTKLQALQVSPWDPDLERKTDDEQYELNLTGAQVSGSVWMDELEDVAEIDLEDSRSGTIVVKESTVPGYIRLYEATSNALQLQSNPWIKEINLWYASLDKVQFGTARGSSELNSIDELNGRYVSAKTSFHFSSTIVNGDAYLGNLSTGNLFVECARFRGKADFEVLNTPTSVNFQSVSAKELDLYGTKLHNLEIGAKSGWCTDAPETKLGEVSITNASIENATISGAISSKLDMSGSRFDSVKLADLTVGSNAEVDLRSARINALSASQKTFATKSLGKHRTKLRGAEVETIYLVGYDKSDDPSAMLLPNGEEIAMDISSDAVAQSAFFLETLPREFGLENDGQYAGNAYYALRRSATAAGYPDVERELAIRQNLHLMQQMRGLGAKTLYTLGHWINDFGYNNQRAFFLLAALWVLGVVVANINYLAWVAAHLRKNEEAAPSEKPQFRFVHPLFLSIDRTIPTLGLDSGFGSPHSSLDDNGSTGRKNAVVAFFYVQRIAGFVIVLFVLGGVFDVFE